MTFLMPGSSAFTHDVTSPDFSVILGRAFGEAGSIKMRLEKSTTSVEFLPRRSAADPISLDGWCLEPDLDLRKLNSAPEKILLPFILDIRSISLPGAAIISVGKRGRSVADFFLRNLFLALMRNQKVRFFASPESTVPKQQAKLLTKHYSFVFSHFFSEPLLSDRTGEEAVELLMSNILYPMGVFQSVLLNRACAKLEKKISKTPKPLARQDSQVSEIMACRAELTALYRALGS